MLRLSISRTWLLLAGVCLAPVYTFPSSTSSEIDLTTTLTATQTATSFITVSPKSPCVAKCTISYPDEEYYEWQKISITANFTHATVVEIVNTVQNTTRYTTIFNEVPANVTLPPTNEAGTRVATTTILAWPNTTITTVIAYPTVYYDYGGAYAWIGTHEFTLTNSTYCGTAKTTSTISMKSHPIISKTAHYWWSEDFEAYRTCTSSLKKLKSTGTVVPAAACTTYGHAYPRGGDKTGFNYRLAAVHYEGSFLRPDLFPEFGQFTNCSMSANAPEGYVESVAILTVSSVSHEDTPASSTTAAPLLTLKQSSAEARASAEALPLQQKSSTIKPTEGIPTAQSTTNSLKVTLVINSQSIEEISESQFVVGSQTLNLDSPITLGTGTATTVVVLSTINAKERILVVGSSTTILPHVVTQSTVQPASVIRTNSMTENRQSRFIVSSQTLEQVDHITIGTGEASTVVALTTDAASRTLIVVGDSTATFPFVPIVEKTSHPALPPLVVGSLAISTNNQGQYVVGGQTVTQGGSLTLGSGASTTVVALATASFSEGIGSLIFSGLGGSQITTGSSSAPTRPKIGSSATPASSTSYRRTVGEVPMIVFFGLVLLLNGFWI